MYLNSIFKAFAWICLSSFQCQLSLNRTTTHVLMNTSGHWHGTQKDGSSRFNPQKEWVTLIGQRVHVTEQSLLFYWNELSAAGKDIGLHADRQARRHALRPAWGAPGGVIKNRSWFHSERLWCTGWPLAIDEVRQWPQQRQRAVLSLTRTLTHTTEMFDCFCFVCCCLLLLLLFVCCCLFFLLSFLRPFFFF